ncbi:unnamed protein product [Rotaria sp. Silwood2]|nr:unnamed protein product [Rotaria sp. Silwood2]CAF4255238.1 unnamed protein product [Rotaria sp. Silwood2]
MVLLMYWKMGLLAIIVIWLTEHIQKNSHGKRKNYGLNGIHDHLAQYKSKSKSILADKQGKSVPTIASIIQSKFALNKNVLPEEYKLKLKDAELKFYNIFVNDIYELKHTLLICKHFDAEKTEINIWHEIEHIFHSFNLSFGDNPITIDQGPNTIKALSLNDETRYPCLAHRTNTVLETTWENGKNMNVEFKNFCSSVSDLRTYCQQCGGIQFKLPKTLKRTSGTRPWRSYFLILDSLHQSYESLMVLLRERDEQHRLLQIDPQLLYEISKFMENFSLIFDNLEFSNRPTLQNVIPSYYRMIELCFIDNKRKHSIINLLKAEIAKELDEKYLTSTTQLHWIATYLDQTFKDFCLLKMNLF